VFTKYRVDGVINYGEVTSFNQLNWSVIDSLVEDNTESQIIYHPDIAGTNTRNLVHEVSLFSNTGSKIQHTISNFNTSAQMTQSQVWNNQSNSFTTFGYHYDPKGNVDEVTSPQGLRTLATFDGHLLKTFTIDPGNYNFIYNLNYDPNSLELTSITPASGISTFLTYDPSNRLKQIKLKNGLDERLIATFTSELKGITGSVSKNSLTQVVNGETSISYFDGFGNLIQERNVSSQNYETQDFVLGTSGLERQSNKYFGFGATNQPHSSTVHGLNIGFDDAARVNSETPDQNGNGNGSNFLENDLYGDPRGRLSTDALQKHESSLLIGALGTVSRGSPTEAETFSIFHDLPESTLRLMDSGGNNFSTTFDSLARYIHLSPPLSAALTISYKQNGMLNTIIDSINGRARFNVDPLGRLINYSVTSPGKTPVVLDMYYDVPTRIGYFVPPGSLSLLVGDFDQAEFSYTPLGDIKNIIQTIHATGESYLFRFSYDANGNVTDILYPNGVHIVTEYDQARLEKKIYSPELTSMFPAGLISEIISRNANRRILNRNWGNGTNEDLSYYSNSGSLASYGVITNGVTQYLSNYIYDNQNLTTKQELVPGYNKVTEYGYDSVNRLNRLTVNGTPYFLNRDSLGRVTQNTLLYPGATYQYASNTNPYKPTSLIGGGFNELFSYNGNKQQTSSFNRTFTYDASGQVSQIVNANNETLNIERSVFGNILHSIENVAGVQTKTTHIGPAGLYEIVNLNNGSIVRNIINVMGEKTTTGAVGFITSIELTPSPPPAPAMDGKDPQDPPTTPPNVPLPAPKCGDGKVNAGEECDDGNKSSGDGCDDHCKWEARPPGTLPSPIVFPPADPVQTGIVLKVEFSTGQCATITLDQTGNVVSTGIMRTTFSCPEEEKEYNNFTFGTRGPCVDLVDTGMSETDAQDIPDVLIADMYSLMEEDLGGIMGRDTFVGGIIGPDFMRDYYKDSAANSSDVGFWRSIGCEVYGMVTLAGFIIGPANEGVANVNSYLADGPSTGNVIGSGLVIAGILPGVGAVTRTVTKVCKRAPRMIRTGVYKARASVTNGLDTALKPLGLSKQRNLYHYTSINDIDLIRENGIGRPGSTRVFMTDIGDLSPVRAKRYLALDPTRANYPNYRITLDSSEITKCGINIPGAQIVDPVLDVGSGVRMSGGGIERVFSEVLPPSSIKEISVWDPGSGQWVPIH